MPEFEKTMDQKDNKLYRVQITEIDGDTLEQKEVFNNTLSSVVMVGDDAEDNDKMCEIVLNDSLHGIATKLASGRKLKSACRLAHMYLSVTDDKMKDIEGLLADAVMGGLQ